MAKLKQLLGVIIGIHLVWWLVAILLNRSILPGPVTVYAAFPSLWQAQIGWHIYFSLYRLFWSLLIATVIGVLTGMAIVRFPRLGRVLDPLIYLTYPIPKIAFLPVAMLLFGLGDLSKIIMISFIVVFQVIISVRDHVAAIPASLYQTFATLDANRWELFRFITWPASITGIISALRIALGTAIATLFFTEVYGTNYGLGYFIMDAWNRLDYPGMYAGIIVISVVAFCLFALLNAIERLTVKWQKDEINA
ncbi:ABC transporter permease [Lacticaseibacillus brantae]|uniref:ABC transporter transmembrane protein n=1 Tax=Lacticaseibacillus brantae DSM 23927 TaxID=1423727 RepID=A0A0R2AY36_9LACO|nr:ABC transporter permease [Lacticaseibacillus brantae]KRM71642.1 ABC transporter transmembrane protein [Lacticaseibacillus brantae DSM 23927]